MKRDIPVAEVIDRLVRWADNQAQIRAMLLTSSRAIAQGPVDRLSDYDVVLVVEDAGSFAANTTWIHDFGTPLVRFQVTGQIHGIQMYTRLVLYDDGTKIDYSVWSVALLRRILEKPELPDNLDVGYRVLLDKDGLTHGLRPPSYTAHIPDRPRDEEYQDLVGEFWWETIYVAKNLWRDELIHAKYNLEYVMKLQLLRKLLEWRVELDHDWSIRPGSIGRELKKRLDRETWSELESTYVGADIEENWEALFRTTALFRRIAGEVGAALGFIYPHELDARVTRYLQEIRQLEH